MSFETGNIRLERRLPKGQPKTISAALKRIALLNEITEDLKYRLEGLSSVYEQAQEERGHLESLLEYRWENQNSRLGMPPTPGCRICDQRASDITLYAGIPDAIVNLPVTLEYVERVRQHY